MTLAKAYKQQFGKVSYPFEIHDSNGNRTYLEASNGSWWKGEYNANGKLTYYEDSHGFWEKRKYDSNGNQTYFENSNGYWEKREYDDNGNETYWETSNGHIEGQKQTIEIDGVEYSAEQVRERIAELKPMQDK